MAKFEYEPFNSKIYILQGTRTPIEVILYRLKESNSIQAIHEMYPWIDEPTLSGAIEEAIRTVTKTLHAKTVLVS